MSCAHGIEVNKSLNDQRFFIKYQGQKLPVRLLFYELNASHSDDMALFFLEGQRLQPVFQLSKTDPPMGTKVVSNGYPGSRLRQVSGRTIPSIYPYHRFAFNRVAISGESGGPIVRKSTGRIDGVISTANSAGFSTIISVSKLRRWLIPKLDTLPIDRLSIVTNPKPEEPIVIEAPFADIAKLLKRILALEAKIALLESRQPQKGDKGEQGVRGDRGLQGAKGAKGSDGSLGTVTVRIIDKDGKQIRKDENLDDDDVVNVHIDRFLKGE